MGHLKKFLKRFMCWFDLHSYGNYEQVTRHGFNDHYRCRWCGKEGLVDSHGALF
jgi:hypothetical protein